jgi:hypothetical protein
VFDLPGSSSIALVGRLERAQRNENGAGVDSNYGDFRYLQDLGDLKVPDTCMITVARELAPAGLRSSPNGLDAVLQVYRVFGITTAAPPSGSKLPHHKSDCSC